MKMYFFFCSDSQGNPTYGEEWFVMSDSLDNAKAAIENTETFKRDPWYYNLKDMAVREFNINEPVQTELS